jgi:UDP-galactopyranose mutase
MKYDYLIVGSGIYGATFAELMKKAKKSCWIVEKRNHIAGNCFTNKFEDIDIHVFGPHIFHTNKKEVWDYLNNFCSFNNYRHSGKVRYKDKVYSFPINLMTMNQLWGVTNPEEAEIKLQKVRYKINNPKNMEEWCLSQIGEELYEIFIKDYSTKQWGKNPRDLPASIVKRLPVYLNFNENYYKNDQYQGIPSNGYTEMISNMIGDTKVDLCLDFFEIKNEWKKYADKLVYCGPIDQFYNYNFGKLDYRSLAWKTEIKEGDFQGCSVMNYTDLDNKFTRAIEHKHFNFKNQKKSVITYEYPNEYSENVEPYYPINDDINNKKYFEYSKILEKEKDIIITGRLGKYKYFDMDDCVSLAFKEVEKELGFIPK